MLYRGEKAILEALERAEGSVVSYDALHALVRLSTVPASNAARTLSPRIQKIRKSLSDGMVCNIAGKGYAYIKKDPARITSAGSV